MTILVVAIVVVSGAAAFSAIFLDFGAGAYIYESIRGVKVEIYGKGIYHHMPTDVAIQGIAQDYVTLFIAIPLLLIALAGYLNNSVKSHFLLSGVMGYFFVTYWFYTAMGMYNVLFLCYVVLLGLSFFGLFLSARQLESQGNFTFSVTTPIKAVGIFMIVNAVSIALLWLGVVVPPLLDGTIYPVELSHFTTLIVQGYDLGLLLPICFVVGILLYKNKQPGFTYSTIYLGFLSLLMTALTAKIIAMAMHGVNVIPAVFIIPVFNIVTVISLVVMIRGVKSVSSVM